VWQQVYQGIASPGFELIAVAVDPGGPDEPRPFVEAAHATYPVLVDSTGKSSAALGFKVVPNGILVDAEGIVRYRRDGGFSNANAADLAAVERFARGGDPGQSPDPSPVAYQLGALERELITTKMELGRVLDSVGRREEAIAQWRDALHLDPENLTIRKAIWGVQFPERFHPVIDWDWQREQLPRERAAEIAAGICGPDGCPIPAAQGH